MKKILGYISAYAKTLNVTVFIFCTLFISLLIFFNYRYQLEANMSSWPGFPVPYFTGHFLLFTGTFGIPYLLYLIAEKKSYGTVKPFWLLLVLAPALFALKMAMNSPSFSTGSADWNRYWEQILYWPSRLLVLTAILLIIWKWLHRDQPFYGLTTKAWDAKPYFIMLLLMIPLLVAASTQADFLHTYPKLQRILPLPDAARPGVLYQLLFELSYGSDFFSIELFFRGFLILGFAKWVGKDAILPMACFYCSIHFGKPLGECISSYFGGLLLGIVVYNTRSIYGGLMVHLGIAWLMELAGYGGHHFW